MFCSYMIVIASKCLIFVHVFENIFSSDNSVQKNLSHTPVRGMKHISTEQMVDSGSSMMGCAA